MYKTHNAVVKNSIIVPAYNEEKRAMLFIPSLIDFVGKHISNSEIIIVNDGSRDNTFNVIRSLIKQKKAESFVKIIGYSKNQGKGNAVAFGVKLAKGDKILFIDADGSIPPSEIPLMLEKLEKYDFVSGNRLSSKSKIKTSLLRKIFSLGFNSFVSLVFQYSYRDNLCGFKGFKEQVAHDLFSTLLDKRWVFDVELFYRAKQNKYSTYFLPIRWKHIGGSRINLFTQPFAWAIKLILLRIKLRNF